METHPNFFNQSKHKIMQAYHPRDKYSPDELQHIFNQLHQVELDAWSHKPEYAASKDSLISRFKGYEEGFVVIRDHRNELAGFCSSAIFPAPSLNTVSSTSYLPVIDHPNWFQLTDRGTLKNSLPSSAADPKSHALWIVSITVKNVVDESGKKITGLGQKIISKQKQKAGELSLPLMVAPSPDERTYTEFMQREPNATMTDYLNQKNEDGKMLDPKLRFYVEKCGFVPQAILKGFMDFYDTNLSVYDGVLMRWSLV